MLALGSQLLSWARHYPVRQRPSRRAWQVAPGRVGTGMRARLSIVSPVPRRSTIKVQHTFAGASISRGNLSLPGHISSCIIPVFERRTRRGIASGRPIQSQRLRILCPANQVDAVCTHERWALNPIRF